MSKQPSSPPPGDRPAGQAPPPPPGWRHWLWPVALFASLLLFYPLVYYVSFPHPRYRHPIDPMLLMLAVYLFTQVGPRNPKPKGADHPLHAD